jgi:hypothetical protein
MSDYHNVELDPELMATFGLNPLARCISSSRAAMFTGNLSQMVVIKNPTRKRLMSGMEREFGKTTCSIEFEDDVEIIKVIPRFAHTAGKNRIRKSPQTAVIYENYHTKEIGVVMITDYNVTHQHFGTEFKKHHDVINRITPKAKFSKGTKIASSPLIDADGNYMYGRETNVLMSSDVAGTEDGVKARRGYMESLAPTGFETRVFEFGKTHYPTNQATEPGVYQVFPELGDKVNTNCLLVSMRRYDPINAVSNMTVEALQMPDYIFDRKRFIQHPDAEVVDIRVERNTSINIPPLPVGMDEQLWKYYNADTEYYKKIVDCWNDLRISCARRGVQLNLEPEFGRLVVEGIARLGNDYIRPDKSLGKFMDHETNKVNKQYRGVPLDAWRVEITFKYNSIPNKGYKITDIDGDKSVVVEVVDDEDMPVDENGVVADIVVDPNSRWNRMTPASPVEMAIAASGRDLGKRLQARFGWDKNAQLEWDEVESRVFDTRNDELVHECYAELLEYYKCVAPFQYEDLTNPEYLDMFPDAIRTHVANVIHDHMPGLFLYFPTNNPVHIPTMLREIQNRWPPFITPVRFRGRDGKMKVSRESMMIASSYYITLEKTAEDGWMASASAKLQAYGTTARLGNHDKYDSPGRPNPVRKGESEIRLESATCGGESTADRADASNNPLAHKFILRTLLTHETPTNVPVVLDREVVPRGGHRPLSYFRHIMNCSGKELSNAPA